MNNKEALPPHEQGIKNAVCAVFATQGIDCKGYYIYRHGVGLGDHMIHELDITMESLYGTSAPTPKRCPGHNLQYT